MEKEKDTHDLLCDIEKSLVFINRTFVDVSMSISNALQQQEIRLLRLEKEKLMRERFNRGFFKFMNWVLRFLYPLSIIVIGYSLIKLRR